MKIIVGYDGTNIAKKALEVAKKHAKVFNGRIYIITSLIGGTHDSAKSVIEARRNLKYAIKSIEIDGIPCEKHLLIRGMEPGEDIVKFAEDNQADEVIIGVVKKSKVQKFLLGSNAQYVILHSPCMVITVK